jgi:hypothetical protein
MEKKQTAVELLEQAYWDNKGTLSQKHFDQAKQMEKEQIVNAVDGFPLYTRDLLGDDYYNELYGGEN